MMLEEFVRKSLSRSKKKKNFLLMKPIEQKRFWLICGDGEGNYKQYDRVTLLGDDSRTEMSWGDFKRFVQPNSSLNHPAMKKSISYRYPLCPLLLRMPSIKNITESLISFI